MTDKTSVASMPKEGPAFLQDSGTEVVGQNPPSVLSLVSDELRSLSCRIDLCRYSDAEDADSPFDQATRVAQAEPLFDAIEHWLGISFDVMPFDEHVRSSCQSQENGIGSGNADMGEGVPTQHSDYQPTDSVSLRLHLIHRESAQAAILHMPVQAIGRLPLIPEEVSTDVDIQLEPTMATCRVARMMLPAEQLNLFKPGAVLLLPETYQQDWTVHLISDGVATIAQLDVETSTLTIPPGQLNDEQSCRCSSSSDEMLLKTIDIVLDASVAWDPIAVLSGSCAIQIELQSVLSECGFLCLVDGHPHLNGHVARLGDGYGFFAMGASSALLQDGSASMTSTTEEN